MNPEEIIRKKRNGCRLSRSEMEFLIEGYLKGKITDYHMAAFFMAVYFQKMDFDETTILTDIMLNSGHIVDLSAIQGIKVDKHSTGGVGDKVSLILAPMVAACGVPVPMISGRGLGHTGGTLDKLEAIPGFRTILSLEEYSNAIQNIGLVMIGQTNEIAPADKKMYALRDVTGTVECIPLIVSSIMSKKLAEGIDALVFDVKTGRGAFMQTEAEAIELAKMLIAVGKKFGKKTMGFITDMSQPLGFAIGNWLEVRECIECLRGENITDLMDVTYLLGGAMLMLGGKASTVEEGMERCRGAIQKGDAWKKFLALVKNQGGTISVLENPSLYPKSKFVREIVSSAAGDIDDIDAFEIGYAAVMLGAGRLTINDSIDPKAGIILQKKVGDSVIADEPMAIIHTEKEEVLDAAAHRVERAFNIATEPSVSFPLIYAMVDEEGIHSWHH